MSAQPKSSEFPKQSVEVYAADGLVFCNDRVANLRRRPLCYRLFEAFAQSPGRGWSKAELMVEIYPVTKGMDCSDRMWRCLEHNLIKLLSRARLMAYRQLHNDLTIDWFWFEPRVGKWFLFRPSHHDLYAGHRPSLRILPKQLVGSI